MVAGGTCWCPPLVFLILSNVAELEPPFFAGARAAWQKLSPYIYLAFYSLHIS